MNHSPNNVNTSKQDSVFLEFFLQTHEENGRKCKILIKLLGTKTGDAGHFWEYQATQRDLSGGIWRPSAIVYSAVTPWTEQPDMEKESWTYIFWLIDGQILTVNA